MCFALMLSAKNNATDSSDGVSSFLDLLGFLGCRFSKRDLILVVPIVLSAL